MEFVVNIMSSISRQVSRAFNAPSPSKVNSILLVIYKNELFFSNIEMFSIDALQFISKQRSKMHACISLSYLEDIPRREST